MLISICQLILMVKQQNNSASPTTICFLRLCCNFCGFVLHCQHDFSAVLCTTFLRVIQVFLTSPCSNIIVTILQVFFATFAALCCTVSTILFRILHVTFAVSCTAFLQVFHVAVTASCCTVSTALL